MICVKAARTKDSATARARRLIQLALMTEMEVEAARKQAHLARAEYKKARKTFKQAKRKAKRVRKEAETAARELNGYLAKKSPKTAKRANKR